MDVQRSKITAGWEGEKWRYIGSDMWGVGGRKDRKDFKSRLKGPHSYQLEGENNIKKCKEWKKASKVFFSVSNDDSGVTEGSTVF